MATLSPPASTFETAGRWYRQASRLTKRLRAGRPHDSPGLSKLGILAHLHQHGASSASAVAEYLGLQPQSLTRLLAAMERDGLISRGVEETDRRKSRLAITEAGTRLLASDLDERKLRLATSMAQLLSPTEQEMLRIAITLMERLMPLGESPVHSPATIRSASEICRPPNHDSASSNPMQPYISSITLGVTDLARAIRFYRDGLGFPTQVEEGAPFAFFTTNGTRLSLIPLERLVAYIGPGTQTAPGHFGGLTLAHHVREKEHVVQVLAQAERAGATLVKPAKKTFWGGYSGIFSDFDGYLWEIAWGPMFKFDEQGALLF